MAKTKEEKQAAAHVRDTLLTHVRHEEGGAICISKTIEIRSRRVNGAMCLFVEEAGVSPVECEDLAAALAVVAKKDPRFLPRWRYEDRALFALREHLLAGYPVRLIRASYLVHANGLGWFAVRENSTVGRIAHETGSLPAILAYAAATQRLNGDS